MAAGIEQAAFYIMAKQFAKPFYNSKLWKQQRAYILARDHYTCTQPGCRRPATEVHHIEELTEQNISNPRIALAESNLRSLCEDCHKQITKQMKQKNFGVLESIAFDEKGYPVVTK